MHRRAGVVYVHAVAAPARDRATRWGDPRLPVLLPLGPRPRRTWSGLLPHHHPPMRARRGPPLPSSCQPPNRFLSSSESDVLRLAWSGMQVPGPDRPGGPRAIAIVDVDVPRAVYSSQSCTPRFHPSRIHFSSPITGTRRSTGPLLLRCMYVLAAPFSRYRYRTP